MDKDNVSEDETARKVIFENLHMQEQKYTNWLRLGQLYHFLMEIDLIEEAVQVRTTFRQSLGLSTTHTEAHKRNIVVPHVAPNPRASGEPKKK